MLAVLWFVYQVVSAVPSQTSCAKSRVVHVANITARELGMGSREWTFINVNIIYFLRLSIYGHQIV